jgi:hypothetical protein
VDIKFSTSPKEATMYRRKRRILSSLVLGFAVAAFAAPAALGEPRGAGNSPTQADFWNYDATTGEKVANTSPGVSPIGLMRIYDVDATAAGSDDRSLYRGTSPQLDPTIVGSPDDRKVYRGVETVNVPSLGFGPSLSPAIRGEQVKSVDRPSFAPVSQPSVTGSTDDGFQWVDAGFGAVSTLALVLLMGAAALMIRNQRRRIAAY